MPACCAVSDTVAGNAAVPDTELQDGFRNYNK